MRDSAKAQLALKESGYRTQEVAQVEAEVAQKQAAWQYADNSINVSKGLLPPALFRLMI